jgi:hypothetical protein
MSGIPLWLQARRWGLAAGAALLVGAAIAWFVQVPACLVAAITPFGSGLLISALAFELLVTAYRQGGFIDFVAARFDVAPGPGVRALPAQGAQVIHCRPTSSAHTMTKKKQPTKPTTDTAEREGKAPASGGRPENPFLDGELFSRMRDYTERDAAFSKELKAISERGAGKCSTDAREAPSLAVLRASVKKGLSLATILERITLGVDAGLWEAWLAQFGFELQGVSYAKGGPRNARIALDLSLGSKATAAFANAGVPNWRSLAAEDCVQVQVHKPTETVPAKAFAVFYLEAE